jgi:hexosaminidase
MKKALLVAAIISAASSCCRTEENVISVVPYPNEVEITAGSFKAAGAGFHLSEGIEDASRNVIKGFAEQLSAACGKESTVTEDSSDKGFIFVHDPQMPAEAYALKIDRKAVKVAASGLNGFNYAIQTLKQMLPVEIYGNDAAPGADWKLACCTIEDAPRFGYRGMHMDVSRHFFTMDEVKRYLDVMEIHKLNTLHWHLTDDQGWRVEIKKYPKLTEIGSIRNKTVIGHISRSKEYDTTPYGEGCWYSQEQIKEIIGYAAAKGITVIPEIDLPGHMLAALAAYPEYGCTGGPYEVWGDWGISDDVLCAGNEKTMIFLENILAEICDLFPSEYIHIGGDECPKVRWETCPRCQAKIRQLGLKDDTRHKAEHYLQSYVMERMEKFINSKGKRIIGWDEILEGEVAPDATIMSWRGVAGGLEAVRLGHDAIMTPNTYFYLDYYQSDDKDQEPLGIGGYLPIEKCYSYEPFTADMTDEEKGRIKGVQANLWTEYIADEEHLQYMLLPRMAALSEVQWCKPENKNWERFYDSADEFCAIYDMAGYNYARHIFHPKMTIGTNPEKNCVEVALGTQGNGEIRYTLDGSDPDAGSTLYKGPVTIDGSCTIKATTVRNGRTEGLVSKTFNYHKAMGRPVTVTDVPHRNYTFSCPELLVNGVKGAHNYKNGDWAGWHRKPFEAVIDMGGECAYSTVSISALIEKGDFIFNPLCLCVAVSEDGTTYTEVAKAEYPIESKAAPNGIKEYSVSFPETSARFVKVFAKTLEALPEWHPGAGHGGFLFIDEIVVN